MVRMFTVLTILLTTFTSTPALQTRFQPVSAVRQQFLWVLRGTEVIYTALMQVLMIFTNIAALQILSQRVFLALQQTQEA